MRVQLPGGIEQSLESADPRCALAWFFGQIRRVGSLDAHGGPELEPGFGLLSPSRCCAEYPAQTQVSRHHAGVSSTVTFAGAADSSAAVPERTAAARCWSESRMGSCTVAGGRLTISPRVMKAATAAASN